MLIDLSQAKGSGYAKSRYCLIGGGLAGLLLARRLAQVGQRVIVLESGAEVSSDEVNQLNEIEDPGRLYTRSMNGRNRALGGTSHWWGGRLIPISEGDVAPRPHISATAWPFETDELVRYEPQIERLFGVAGGTYDDLESDSATASSGFPKDDPSISVRWAKCPSFKNCNIATLLKDELRKSTQIEIWLGATVCDFELDREAGRLAAVVARDLKGNELRVRADTFVFAAGTIETTRLLLLLDAAGENRVFQRCEVLGRYFQDHLKAQVATVGRADPLSTNRLFGYRFVHGTRRDLHLELSRDEQEKDAVASAFAYLAMDLTASPLSHVKKMAQGFQRREFDHRAARGAARNLGLLGRTAWWRYVNKQLFVPPGVELKVMACVEQLPSFQNRIRLSAKRDRLGSPMAHLEWAPTPRDEATFRSLVKGLTAYWRRSGLDRICPLDLTVSAADVANPIIAQAEACAHPSGSTRMGVDPRRSVVGPDLHCHALPNVAVVSASVFPTAGSANPTFTIMKLALWLADSLLANAASPRPRPALGV